MNQVSRNLPIHRTGFSLVELVIVMLVLGILAGVGAPRFFTALGEFEIAAAAKRVQADLRLARQRAIAACSSQEIIFVPASSTYYLPGVADMDHPERVYTIELGDAPYNSSFSVTGAGNTITFDHHGQTSVASRVTVRSAHEQRSIVVEQGSGNIRIE